MLAGFRAYGFGEADSDESAHGRRLARIAVRPGLQVEFLHGEIIAGWDCRGVTVR